MTPVEVLTAARAKISQGWTRGQYARTEDGLKTDPHSQEATCWCAAGAMLVATSLPTFTFVSSIVGAEFLISAIPPDAPVKLIGRYNDSLPDQEAALAWFDRAIALAAAAA